MIPKSCRLFGQDHAPKKRSSSLSGLAANLLILSSGWSAFEIENRPSSTGFDYGRDQVRRAARRMLDRRGPGNDIRDSFQKRKFQPQRGWLDPRRLSSYKFS